jgi:hypothetical protein
MNRVKTKQLRNLGKIMFSILDHLTAALKLMVIDKLDKRHALALLEHNRKIRGTNVDSSGNISHSNPAADIVQDKLAACIGHVILNIQTQLTIKRNLREL